MQIMEGQKKAGLFKTEYAAMVVIAPESEDHFLSELSQAAGALLNWKGNRKSSAKTVRVTVVCKESMNAWVKEVISDQFAKNNKLIGFTAGMNAEVSILNKGETAAEVFTI